MIVRCSACTTRYRIDPAALGETGRRVRCTCCGHVWREPPPAGAATPSATPPPPPRRRRPAVIGWLAAGVVAAGVLAGLALARNAIVETWPGTVRHYDSVGLSVAVPLADGLRIVDVASDRLHDGDRIVLLARGIVRNASGHRRTVPALQAVLTDEAGEILHRWRMASVARILDTGQSTTFDSWLADPPAGAVRLAVDFAADDPA